MPSFKTILDGLIPPTVLASNKFLGPNHNAFWSTYIVSVVSAGTPVVNWSGPAKIALPVAPSNLSTSIGVVESLFIWKDILPVAFVVLSKAIPVAIISNVLPSIKILPTLSDLTILIPSLLLSMFTVSVVSNKLAPIAISCDVNVLPDCSTKIFDKSICW